MGVRNTHKHARLEQHSRSVNALSQQRVSGHWIDLLAPLSHLLNTPASLYHYVDTHGIREYIASDLLIKAKRSHTQSIAGDFQERAPFCD
jgi:hypothetical protein